MNFQIVEHISSMPAFVSHFKQLAAKPAVAAAKPAVAAAKPAVVAAAKPAVVATVAAKPAVVATPAAKPAVVATPAAKPAVVATPAAKPSIAPPTRFSYEAVCSKVPGQVPGQSKLICVCDPDAKGYKLDGSVCKPDASVKACPIVNKKQLKLGANGLCV
jgi:hypothetical protein